MRFIKLEKQRQQIEEEEKINKLVNPSSQQSVYSSFIVYWLGYYAPPIVREVPNLKHCKRVNFSCVSLSIYHIYITYEAHIYTDMMTKPAMKSCKFFTMNVNE